MNRTVVTTPSAPAAIGPYSQAVCAGDLVFCSGQIPLDPATGELCVDSIEVATERCLENLQAVLAAAGSSLGEAVQVMVYMTDLGLFARMNEVYARFFPENPPARMAVGVASLPKGAPIEIACVACRT
jgi:2-iminobutanoate/2-iminopropanoate deaminase